jgi:hypothetical protein
MARSRVAKALSAAWRAACDSTVLSNLACSCASARRSAVSAEQLIEVVGVVAIVAGTRAVCVVDGDVVEVAGGSVVRGTDEGGAVLEGGGAAAAVG